MEEIKEAIKFVDSIIQDEVECTAGMEVVIYDKLKTEWTKVKEVLENGC